jgi:hypothetical protein
MGHPDFGDSLALFLVCGFLPGGYPAGFGGLAGAAEGEGSFGDVFGDAGAGGDVGAGAYCHFA